MSDYEITFNGICRIFLLNIGNNYTSKCLLMLAFRPKNWIILEHKFITNVVTGGILWQKEHKNISQQKAFHTFKKLRNIDHTRTKRLDDVIRTIPKKQ